jgi:hypothetical protein
MRGSIAFLGIAGVVASCRRDTPPPPYERLPDCTVLRAGQLGPHPGYPFALDPSILVLANQTIVASWWEGSADQPGAIIYSISGDGGASWGPPDAARAPVSYPYEPSLAADSAGNVFLTFAGASVLGATTADIYLAKMVAGSSRFAPAPRVSGTTDGFRVMPAVRADAGKVWVAFRHESGATSSTGLELLTSTDSGTTFTTSTIASWISEWYPAWCRGPGGGTAVPFAVVATWLDPMDADIRIHYSSDVGASWMTSVAPPPRPGDTTPSCVTVGSDLWIAYGAYGEDLELANYIVLVHSSDGGGGFDSVKAISDGPASDFYMLPRMALGPDGRLTVLYYQGPSSGPARLIAATSRDRGSSWTRCVVANTGTIESSPHRSAWLGESIDLVAQDHDYVVYVDNSAGIGGVFFAVFDVP